ncbi:MAG TPA: CBS domain-containing protein [Saprospiraceae bacterium]|nr:CBS domain-containing protein [Saprospiraceae bacterium]HPN70456.1 CBS domain-containing protein [Saprospiraceae bacterium]
MINNRITEFMAKDLIVFYPDTDIKQAIKVMVKNKISGAPVVDFQGTLVGVLSEKDCLKPIVDAFYHQRPGGSGIVGDYMSTSVKSLSSTKTLIDAAYEFVNSSFKRFPVVDHTGKLLGQISRSDALRVISDFSPDFKQVPDTWKIREPQF